MDDSERLAAEWLRAAEALTPGWTLDSLRCASTGLSPDERSTDWVAVAVSSTRVERSHRAADPVAALDGLVADLAAL